MKSITEKQIVTIQKLAKAAKTEIKNVDKMSCNEASMVITALIEKVKKSDGNRKDSSQTRNSDSRSDPLAGLAVKILAQKCHISYILHSDGEFKKRAVELYKVFISARRACFA
jgi:hypothetical protein